MNTLIIDPLSPFGEEQITQHPGLRAVATPSTGTNHIDLEACERHGVRVFSLLDDRKALDEITASSEHTFLLVLAALRRLPAALEEVRGGRWRKHRNMFMGNELAGKRVGLVGFGRIGKNLYRYFQAFGAAVMRVYDPPLFPNHTPEALEYVFSDSDIVVICCALTDETRGMIDRSLLESMKADAVLVNTSRGEVINERDLANVLARRYDLRVALDVLDGEVEDRHHESPLFDMRNVLITPHMAGVTEESEAKARAIAERLLERYERSQNQEPAKIKAQAFGA